MEHKSGCLLCGKNLVYTEISSDQKCCICGETFSVNVHCVDGHFICDNCHRLDAFDYIEMFCANSNDANPITMAETIMKNDSVKMHGPEHHFLVPAVLLSSYYNLLNDDETKKKKIAIARKRSESVPGGFCGFYGSCGAGIGTGIFISLIKDATPLSKNEWKLANLMTSKSLSSIADNGGPRCCKRDSYLSIIEAVRFLKENFNIEMEIDERIKCGFSEKNKECLFIDCMFFARK